MVIAGTFLPNVLLAAATSPDIACDPSYSYSAALGACQATPTCSQGDYVGNLACEKTTIVNMPNGTAISTAKMYYSLSWRDPNTDQETLQYSGLVAKPATSTINVKTAINPITGDIAHFALDRYNCGHIAFIRSNGTVGYSSPYQPTGHISSGIYGTAEWTRANYQCPDGSYKSTNSCPTLTTTTTTATCPGIGTYSSSEDLCLTDAEYSCDSEHVFDSGSKTCLSKLPPGPSSWGGSGNEQGSAYFLLQSL